MKTAEISIIERDSDVVLHPSGVLNHFVASELKNDFEEIIKKHAKATVLVDLTMEPFAHGKRQGHSPFELLGIDFGTKDWIDLLRTYQP